MIGDFCDGQNNPRATKFFSFLFSEQALYNLTNCLDDEAILMLDAINVEDLVSFFPDDETRRAAFILYLKGFVHASKQPHDPLLADGNMKLESL